MANGVLRGPLFRSKKPNQKNIRGERLRIVGADSAKAIIMGRLRNAQPGTPGYSHFPADCQRPYFEQLLGESLVTTYSKGQPVREWRPNKGVRHEALDARVHAFGALRVLVYMGMVLDAEAERISTSRVNGPQHPLRNGSVAAVGSLVLSSRICRFGGTACVSQSHVIDLGLRADE